MAAALVVTFSRSSALMLMVGLVLLATRALGARRALVSGAVLLVLAGGIAIATSGNVRHALTDSHRLERVSEGRFDLMKGGLTIWREQPVAGAGLGGFQTRFEQTLTPVEQRRVRVVISHNSPITVLSEGGVIGFALFLALIGGAGWAVVRGSRDQGQTGWARWTLGAILVGILVHSLLYAALFEDPFVWVATGAAVALALALAGAARPRGGGGDVTGGLRVLCLSNMWPGPEGSRLRLLRRRHVPRPGGPRDERRSGGDRPPRRRAGAHAGQVRLPGRPGGAPRAQRGRDLRPLPLPDGGRRVDRRPHRAHPLRDHRPRPGRAQPGAGPRCGAPPPAPCTAPPG